MVRRGRGFEVKHLPRNRFTHPLSLLILYLQPSPRRDSSLLQPLLLFWSLKETHRISGNLSDMEFPFGLILVMAVVEAYQVLVTEHGKIRRRILGGTSLDGHCFEPRIMLQNTYAHQYSKDSQFSEVDRKEYQFRTIAIILNY
ncbi:hypothetical protein HID58_054841 [Brassica napus]|uniref:Uncharacterized protein n=1 Tax=Brassica napus TaxID=3708 RepID=A0ABQ8AIM7_BRANA|nr:hypothetical protein HID58_054841 [Brassica napus]